MEIIMILILIVVVIVFASKAAKKNKEARNEELKNKFLDELESGGHLAKVEEARKILAKSGYDVWNYELNRSSYCVQGVENGNGIVVNVIVELIVSGSDSDARSKLVYFLHHPDDSEVNLYSFVDRISQRSLYQIENLLIVCEKHAKAKPKWWDEIKHLF